MMCRTSWSARPCRNSADCQAYIYYDLTDLALPGRCFLLAEVLGPLLPCDHCFTGFPDCRNVTGVSCGFTVETNTTILTRHQFTEPGNTTVNISPLAVLTGDCELSLLAVGPMQVVVAATWPAPVLRSPPQSCWWRWAVRGRRAACGAEQTRCCSPPSPGRAKTATATAGRDTPGAAGRAATA